MSGYNEQDEAELNAARQAYWQWEQRILLSYSMLGEPGEYHLAANRFVLAAESVISDLRRQLRETQRRVAPDAADTSGADDGRG